MKDSFLEQVAHSILDKMDWKQLSRTTFVLPSHRAGLILKNELLQLQKARNAQAIWAPTVQTLTQLQDYLSPLYAEDELFTIVRLYKLYSQELRANSQEPMSLDMFYTWGRQMLADFTNIDASMHAEEVPNFFENTIAAHELSTWQLDPEVEERLRALINPITNDERPTTHDSIKNQYESLWRQLYTLYRDLREQMSAEQKGYPGMRQRAVIELWDDETIQSKIAGRTFVFVGFNYLLPVECELMLRLKEQQQALFYWDYVPDFQTNTKAFSFAQKNAELLGNALDQHQTSNIKHQTSVNIISCVSKEAQAQYVHRWLQQNYTAKGQKVGVVICDETMLEPVIYALPAIQLPDQDAPEPINITKGFPLRNTAVYARAMAWLYDKKNGKADDLVSPDFIESFLKGIFPETTESTQTTESTLSWKDLLILESEYQVRKIANQMRLLIAEGLGDIPITRKLIRLLMRRTMENVTMPFHGEPVTDIQVMGVLETRLLDFDKLLILNVDEGILPQRQTDASFIPFYLRKTYHMQTSDEKATIYAYNFFRLLSRAGHTTLMYGQPDTLGGSRGMSRFIMQILYSDAFDVTLEELQEPNTIADIQPDEKPKVSLWSTHPCHLSPSAINSFITCPLAFYYRYVEHLYPEEEKETQFEDNTIGSFVHHVMEYIYTHFLHCDNIHPTPISPDAIEQIRTSEDKLNEALMAAYDAMNKEANSQEPRANSYIPEEHTSENVVIKGYVRNILERDREDAKVGLQVYMLEQPCYFPVTIEGVGTIQTGGKIDRLDIYGPEGAEILRVIDYKSGGYTDKTHEEKMTANWDNIMADEMKSYVRQTLIYSHAVMVNDKTKLPIEPHLFFCRRRLTDIVTTLDVDNTTVTDYRAIQEPFLETLQAKVKEVVTTTGFPPCEPGKCPPHCKFYRLCGRKPSEY